MTPRATNLALVVVILVCLLPLAAVFLSSWVADANGCTLNEASTHPCIVAGRDVGELLAFGFVSGWFMLVTLPVAFVLTVVLLVRVVRNAIRRRR